MNLATTFATVSYARKLAMDGNSANYIYEKLLAEGWGIAKIEADRIVAECAAHRVEWQKAMNK